MCLPTTSQKKFTASLDQPEFLLSDFAKFDRPGQLHIAFMALHRFVKEEGRLPAPYNKADAVKLLTIAKDVNESAACKVHLQSCIYKVCKSIQEYTEYTRVMQEYTNSIQEYAESLLCWQVEELDERLVMKFAYVASGDVSPMQAVIGSITAQEVIKVIFTSFSPSLPSFLTSLHPSLPPLLPFLPPSIPPSPPSFPPSIHPSFPPNRHARASSIR